MSLAAVPFQPHPAKLEQILDKVCLHRPWFSDYNWDPPERRREAAAQHLGQIYADMLQDKAMLWEVWREAQLVGIISLTDIRHRLDCQSHFIFFDRKLSDKVGLCFDVMEFGFEIYGLEAIRIEIPTYAIALAKWARKKLGFRYEAEGRQPSWPVGARPLSEAQAILGSRKHRAVLYEGSWSDALLLSITREEFNARSLPVGTESG